MIKVINTEKLPIKLWTDFIDEAALEQAKNLANLPFAFKHIAVMPDVHSGYGMPIGGVLATKGVIIPNAVGVDIGCGMCAAKTTLREIDKTDLKAIMSKIRELVPVGAEHQKESQNEKWMPSTDIDKMNIVKQQYIPALKQVGTLGSGNHFIEIQTGSDGHIWIMIHSGSRNIGKRVADYYNNIAQKLNTRWFSSVEKKTDLAFLPIESDEAHNYIDEMKFCIDFALSNRTLMMENIQNCFTDTLKVEFEPMINIAHNYAVWENHFDSNVIVHRKGATRARENEIGIIPGSQGTKSYIVKGLGNEQSFTSCSHGAGRALGRRQAQRELNLKDEIQKLESQGIIHSVRSVQDLDEATGAYKDITRVMSNQQDLVEVLVELKPLAVVKG
jgi:tRNA-splicing ligase RtcB